MACPTCDHTMQGIGEINHGDCRVFWCPRCGTLRYKHSDGQESDAKPTLPERARILLQSKHVTPQLLQYAHIMGVNEACMLPDQRPQ